MEKFVLHQAGELPELRNVTAEKIDPVHHPQHAADFAFARNNPLERLLRRPRVSKCAGDHAEISGEEIRQVRAEIELAFLGQLEHLHHRLGIFFKNILLLRKELALANAKESQLFFRRFQRGRKLKSERVVRDERPLANCSVIRSVTRKIFRVCS